MSKKKKKKNKKRNHPLTALDKFIYYLGIAISIIGTFSFMIWFDIAKNKIAFKDPQAIARSSDAGILFAIPSLLLLIVSLLTLFTCGLTSKTPIFGSKKYSYGEYFSDGYRPPILRRKKHNTQKRSSQRKFVLTLVSIWCAVFLLLTALVPFGLFQRKTLLQDNSIKRINVFGTVEKKYTPNDYSSLTLEAYKLRNKTHTHWAYDITIKMTDGKSYTFYVRYFTVKIPV